MNCLIKHSLSFVMKSLVKRLIDDINEYHHLLTTEDWRLLVNLDQAVGDRQICQNECLGCLEFARMMSMFSNFLNGVLKANKENEALITELRHIFTIPKELDPIALALDLVVSPSYVKAKIPENLALPYEEYAAAVNGEVSRLALDHFLHEQAKCHDTILAYAKLEREQVITYNPTDISVDKELFYVDQNVVSKYGNDQAFSRQIESLKNKLACRFVYSPYVIEDGVKMSRARLTEYFDSIEKLTDNTMLVRSENGVVLAKENIQVTLERVLLWRNATRAAEDLKIHKMNYNYRAHPHYSKRSELSERANKNINELLASFRPYLNDSNFDIDLDDYESDRALHRRLFAATIGKSFSLNALVNGSITYGSDAQCMECIEHLCEFLDLINYQTEPLSELSKIRSSLQDTEHLKHAWKADYFVTDDKRLRIRGDFIYSTLGLSTKFMSTKTLKERITSEFKK